MSLPQVLVALVSEGLHASAATDVAALLDTLEAALREASFTPSRRAILTAEAPRWTAEHIRP
jgi:hypothetical protein